MNPARLNFCPRRFQLSAAIIFAVFCVGECGADNPVASKIELEQLFRDNSRVLNLNENGLSGDGADFLLAETTDAQFVCIAEPHNVREIPQFVTALFDLLQQQRGFHCLAIEQGPFITSQIGELVLENSNEEIRNIAKRHRKAIHFRTVEEVEMIADVARQSKGSISSVWGLDRVLDRSYLNDYLASEAGKADPQREFLQRRADWSEDNLARYGADRNSKAARSADQHREDGFKSGFQHYYEFAKTKDDPAPRVIFRFGHVHMGRQPGRSFDSLGRYLNQFASQNGKSSFHLNIQLINEPGRYWSLTDYPEYHPLAVVGDPHRWVLVDLRPARSPLRAGKLDASDKLKKFVENYDAVLLLGGGSRGRRL